MITINFCKNSKKRYVGWCEYEGNTYFASGNTISSLVHNVKCCMWKKMGVRGHEFTLAPQPTKATDCPVHLMTSRFRGKFWKDVPTHEFLEYGEKIKDLEDSVNDLRISVAALVDCHKSHHKIIETIEQIITRLDRTNPVDVFETQRKWIGSLVEYGNTDEGFKYGILTNVGTGIEVFPFEIDNGRENVSDCWLPNGSILYKGE